MNETLRFLESRLNSLNSQARHGATGDILAVHAERADVLLSLSRLRPLTRCEVETLVIDMPAPVEADR